MSKSKSGSASKSGATKGEAPEKKTGGSADGRELNKSSSGGGGLFSGLGSIFGGGAGRSSAPTAADRPRARPDVLVSGTGKDRQYTDTRTGQRYSEPDYSAFSLRGLTSTDPANVARNRAGAARYEDMVRDRSGREGNNAGVASLAPPAGTAASPAGATPPLAQIGAPSRPPGPVEVPTPVYGLPSIPQWPAAGPNYGLAFQPASAAPPMDAASMDIFGAYPDFLTYMTAAGNPNYGMYPGQGVPPYFFPYS